MKGATRSDDMDIWDFCLSGVLMRRVALGRVAKLQALCFDVSDSGSLFGATRNIRAYFEEQRKG